MFQPLSTGITFALTEKAPGDKIPLITAGYGRADTATARSSSGTSRCSAPTGTRPTSWSSTSPSSGGFDKLKGKKIALVYHDSPYGKEPIPLLQERVQDVRLRAPARMPVTHPGIEQKSTWLQIRQSGPTTCSCGAGAS